MLASVVIKTTPEDWRVIEELHPDQLANIRTSKEREHLYLLIEKENFNTLEVFGFLAEFFKQQKISIGYCGRVDAQFCLSPGTYAMVFLGEYFDLREAS